MKTRIKKSKAERIILILIRIFFILGIIFLLLPGFSIFENQTLFNFHLKYYLYGGAVVLILMGIISGFFHEMVKLNRLGDEATLNFLNAQYSSLKNFANRMHYDGENASPKEDFDQSKITPFLLTFEARRVSLEVAKAAIESGVSLKTIEKELSSYKDS